MLLSPRARLVALATLMLSASMACHASTRVARLATTDEVAGEPRRTGGEVVVQSGAGEYDVDEHVAGAVGITMTTRWFDGRSEDVLTALGLGAMLMVTPTTYIDWLVPWAYVRVKGALFSIGALDDQFVFGMFSPSAEGGFAWTFGDHDWEMFMLNVGIGVEYDVRFTGPGSEGFWTIGAGLGVWTDDF